MLILHFAAVIILNILTGMLSLFANKIILFNRGGGGGGGGGGNCLGERVQEKTSFVYTSTKVKNIMVLSRIILCIKSKFFVFSI